MIKLLIQTAHIFSIATIVAYSNNAPDTAHANNTTTQTAASDSSAQTAASDSSSQAASSAPAQSQNQVAAKKTNSSESSSMNLVNDTTASANNTENVDAAAAIADEISERSLVPLITDIPSTFTFRSSCIKKTYIDGFYKRQLNAPKLIRNGNGIYTLYATCLNGLGVPVDTKIKLKLIIRHIGDIRTISIRSIIDHTKRYRNCADIANRNGVLDCVPVKKK